jgi:hypothetical protein
MVLLVKFHKVARHSGSKLFLRVLNSYLLLHSNYLNLMHPPLVSVPQVGFSFGRLILLLRARISR